MTVRFLVDEDIRPAIIQGLRFREPAIDILDVKSAGLRGAKHPALLEIAAAQERVLITYDRNTMTAHFYARLAAGKSSPGVIIVPNGENAIGGIIEWLLLVWSASRSQDWRDRIEYIRLP